MNVYEGWPTFPCSKCGTQVIFLAAWQRKDRRCKPCKRKQQNQHNLELGPLLALRAMESYQRRKEYYKQYFQSKRSDPFYLIQKAARRKVLTEITAGRLVRKNCEWCGAEKSQAHHADYSKPLDIMWLCKRCHCKADAMIEQRDKTIEK